MSEGEILRLVAEERSSNVGEVCLADIATVRRTTV